jgi:hypothetical protein
MELPFVASPSLPARLHRLAKLDGTDVAVLGVPIDTALVYRIGTCAIREMSMFHGLGGASVAAPTFLLTVALAAIGLETDISKLYAKGLRPAVLGALAFLFIAIFSFILIKLIG